MSRLSLNEFIGQKDIINDLSCHIRAAQNRGTAVEHILFSGGTGLGKTTLARIVATEMKSTLYEITAANMKKDKFILQRTFLKLKKKDILFIDEIHALKPPEAEKLYTVMESYMFGVLKVRPFTLIGATNYAGTIPKPLRERMVHQYVFQPYNVDDLSLILLQMGAEPEIAVEIAKRAKGTPRVARNLLTKVRNESEASGVPISVDVCKVAFDRMGIDDLGLSKIDLDILWYMRNNGIIDASSAIGERILCAAVGIELVDYKSMIEPPLMQLGFIGRTLRGRIITSEGIMYLNEKIT